MSGEQYDAPNQQVVRADGSGPAEEGTGGEAGAAGGGEAKPAAASANPLDDMTKDELIDEAAVRGVAVSSTMTKAEIREALEA